MPGEQLLMKRGTELIKPFSMISGFDMAIEDENGLVLNGTGKFLDKVGTYRPKGSYFDLTLKTGKAYACIEPKKSEQCRICPMYSKCTYSFTASFPIIVSGEIRGLVGYLGHNKEHRQLFIAKQSVLMNALDNMAAFVSSILCDTNIDNTEDPSALLEGILNELSEGVMFFDSNLRVACINKAAARLFDREPNEIVGCYLKNVMPNIVNMFNKLNGNSDSVYSSTNKNDKTFMSNQLYGNVSLHRLKDLDAHCVIFKNIINNDAPNMAASSTATPDIPNAFDNIVGESKTIREAKDFATRLALSDVSILITGETGVGKELFAKAIHQAGKRCNKPFVVVNCAAIPETLTESELFGYVKGAFSGANIMGKQGKFEVADGGTIFLDEIGELPLSAQSKLLRAVDNLEIEKVGATSTCSVNVRIIAATNRDLKSQVSDGKFREDLFYRLNIIPLPIPPLRERVEDIPNLLNHFFNLLDKTHGNILHSFSPELMNALLSYEWPGNVRELMNACQYIAINYAGEKVDLECLPPNIVGVLNKSGRAKHEFKSKGSMNYVNEILVRQALDRYGYNTEGKKKAAASVGVSLSTLYRKIKAYGLDIQVS